MILFLIQLLIAFACFLFAVLSCFSKDKARSFLFSVFTSVLITVLIWMQGSLSQIMLIVFPLFLLADALFYAFTSSLPQMSDGYKRTAKSRLYLTSIFAGALFSAFLLLYKFLGGDGAWFKEEHVPEMVRFHQVGEIIWGDFYFISVLLSVVILIVAVGSVLMVRVKE